MKNVSCWLIATVLLTGQLWADWPQFRGPGGNGVSDEKDLLAKWSETENVRFKLTLPGLGTSSPIVVDNRLFLTCYSGYAESADEPGDMEKLVRHVVCVDRKRGELLWQKTIKADLPESEYEGGNNTWHGYSSSTPVSDGKNLFVFFGRTGVFCFDFEGNQLWNTKVGTNVRGWGSSNSPILHENLVIVNASIESSSIVALDKSTGEEKWRTEGIRGSWNTPLLVKVGNKSELVVSVPRKIRALDPSTGKELWFCEGIPDDGYVCPSLVSHDGIVYAIGGRKNTAIAVRAGGSGDVTESNIVWRNERAGSNVSSPVYHDGYLYWMHERQGILNCLDAKDGKSVFQERVEPRPGIVYASIVAADDKLYCVSQHNGVYVFDAKPTFKLLAHNTFAGDDNRANASPAIVDGEIYLRNDRFLYCIGDGTRIARGK